MAARRRITIERAEKAASTISATWDKALDGLRDHQPLIILASLSLVVAAFSATISETAIAFAVSAAFAFMASLASSIWRHVRPAKYVAADFEYAATALVSAIAGFGFLVLVGFEIAAKYGLAGRFVAVVIALFFAFGFGLMTVQVLLLTAGRRVFLELLPQPLRSRLTLGRYLFVASYIAALIDWTFVLAQPTIPAWWWVGLFPFAEFGLGITVLYYTLKPVGEAVKEIRRQRESQPKSEGPVPPSRP